MALSRRPGKTISQIGRVATLAGLLALSLPFLGNSAESRMVSSVAAGGQHTCALFDDRTVWCWGGNRDGLLGNGVATDKSEQMIRVAGVNSAVDIAVGINFSCAVLADGTVRCWGGNDRGQLGNGTTTESGIPVTVEGVTDATDVVAGADGWHACALLHDGTIRCWGYNDDGQLGNGTTDNVLVPVAVRDIDSAVALAASDVHTCALLNTGRVRCWGSNTHGQLGDGTQVSSSIPVTVQGLQSVIDIGAGSRNTCAVLENGRVYCWGLNKYGQLGNGTRTTALTPIAVPGIHAATSVDIGGIGHVCVLLRNGGIRCWGFNHAGQVGNGKVDDQSIPYEKAKDQAPADVVGISNARLVTTGGIHTCALLLDGSVWCWGANYPMGGFFSRTSGPTTATPVEIQGLRVGKDNAGERLEGVE